jgi:hypothetical protein
MNIKNLNYVSQSQEADELFKNVCSDIDIWLRNHPNSKRIDDSVNIDSKDVKSFREYFSKRKDLN